MFRCIDFILKSNVLGANTSVTIDRHWQKHPQRCDAVKMIICDEKWENYDTAAKNTAKRSYNCCSKGYIKENNKMCEKEYSTFHQICKRDS